MLPGLCLNVSAAAVVGSVDSLCLGGGTGGGGGRRMPAGVAEMPAVTAVCCRRRRWPWPPPPTHDPAAHQLRLRLRLRLRVRVRVRVWRHCSESRWVPERNHARGSSAVGTGVGSARRKFMQACGQERQRSEPLRTDPQSAV